MHFPRDAEGNLDFKRLGLCVLFIPFDLVVCPFLMAGTVYLFAANIYIGILLCLVEILLIAFAHKKAYERYYVTA